MTEAEIREVFRHHPPTPQKAQMHEDVRMVMTRTAILLGGILPPSRERSTFITKMQEAQMWANAAIAIHVPGEGDEGPGTVTEDGQTRVVGHPGA